MATTTSDTVGSPALTASGRRKDSLDAPAPLLPVDNCDVMNPSLSRPVGDALSLAVKGHHVVVTPVSLLLFSCGPATIFGRVAFRVVDPVKRVAFWAFTHVCEKVFKAKPSFAASYASTSVNAVILISRVKAPLLHVLPSSIGRTPRCPMKPNANTLLSVQFLQLLNSLFSLPAANANAEPSGIFPEVFAPTNDGQRPKDMASVIDVFCTHGGLLSLDASGVL